MAMRLSSAWKAFNDGLALPGKIVAAVAALAIIASWVPKIREWVGNHAAHIETALWVELAGVGLIVLVASSKDAWTWLARRRRIRSILRRYSDGFSYVAREMRPDGPAIRFLLPPRTEFTPAWVPGLVATCAVCGDHPPLIASATPQGIGAGACCRECGTVYSTVQIGEVEGDALRALRQRIASL